MPSYLTNENKIDLLGAAKLKDEPLKQIKARAEILSERLKSILYFSDEIDNKNLIYDEARAEAIDYMSEKAFNILLSEALKAIAISEEYDYPLYINRFLDAFNAHKSELISFIPQSDEKTEVVIDLSPLGDINSWATAVIMARNKLKIGMREDMEERSLYWYSRIYGPARENVQVISYSKKGGQKNLTENFIRKYQKTLIERFKNILEDEAPFWYLIEHGNQPGTMPDEGGYPYPVVAPTHFVSKSEIAIAKIFELVLIRFLNKVLTDYISSLLEILNKGLGKKVSINTIDELFRTLHNLVEKLLTSEEPIEPIDLSKIKSIMDRGTIRAEEFTRRGKRYKALRGERGHFVSSPIPKSKYKRK